MMYSRPMVFQSSRSLRRSVRLRRLIRWRRLVHGDGTTAAGGARAGVLACALRAGIRDAHAHLLLQKLSIKSAICSIDSLGAFMRRSTM